MASSESHKSFSELESPERGPHRDLNFPQALSMISLGTRSLSLSGLGLSEQSLGLESHQNQDPW